MARTVALTTFFRAEGGGDASVGPERYVAGLEDEDGEPWGTAVPLEPDEVEAAVFSNVAFSISMETNGTLRIEAEGRGDAANEAIVASSALARLPLDTAVRSALDTDLLAMEDGAVTELRALRNRLEAAIRMVDEALGRSGKQG